MAELRVNERIRIREVRVIDENGNQLGVLPTEEARKLAAERGFDLVEISPQSSPPVCRIMDYGKYKYQLHKKQQMSKKKHHVMRIKEIRLRPLTEEHDILVKLKKARKFIEHGDKVLINMMFRGRELHHQDIGHTLMQRFARELADITRVESPLHSEGRRLSMTLLPK